jgi:hypothetical protein
MILLLLRPLALCLSGLFLVACAATDTKLTGLADTQQQHSVLLREQSARLEKQDAQLLALASTQQDTLKAIGELNQQLKSNSLSLTHALEFSPAQRLNMPSLSLGTEAPAAKKPRKEAQREPEPQRDTNKLVIGRVEWVWFAAINKKLKARVDTGATLSSIHATKIERFERDGKNWVRFTMRVAATPGQSSTDQDQVFEAPLARNVRIRQASADELDARPVVRLRMRLGQLEEDVDFTLTNRANMNYPVLLGRRFLQDTAVVDVSLKFTQPLDPKAKP